MKPLSFFVLFGLILISLFTNTTTANEDYPFVRSWPQTEQAWNFVLPNDIATDPNEGFIYVAEANGTVSKFTPDGDFITQWQVMSYGEPAHLSAIAIDEAGNVYTAEDYNGRVQKFNGNGEYLFDILLDLEYDFGVPIRLSYITGLAFSPDGFLYLVSAGPEDPNASLRDMVWVFNTEGDYINSWGQPGSAPGQLGRHEEHPIGPADLTIASNGQIYIADTFNHRVQVFTPNGDLITSWGSPATDDVKEPGFFYDLTSIALDRQNYVYVFDNDWRVRSHIQRYDASGHFTEDLILDENVESYGMTIDNQNTLWLADWAQSGVFKLTTTGDILDLWNSASDTPGSFDRPGGLDTDEAGNLYVVDRNNQRIQKFDSTGLLQRTWEARDYAADRGRFQELQYIAVGRDAFYITDNEDGDVIKKYDLEGRYLATWRGPFGGGYLHNLSFDDQENLYVSVSFDPINDSKTLQIIKLNTNGDTLGQFQWVTDELDSFINGIDKGPDGDLYVSFGNHIRKVDVSTGVLIQEWTITESYDLTEKLPVQDIAIDSNGLIYAIIDYESRRIAIYNNQGVKKDEFGQLGDRLGEFTQAHSLSINDNELYVSDSGNNRIQQFNINSVTPENPIVTGTRRDKVIIVAGGGPSTGSYYNAIWDSTLLLANRAYFSLRAQGFDKEDIYYLTAGNTQIDLDNNGSFDDLQSATLSQLEQAITNAASEGQDLVLYLIDHGGPGTFKINNQEILTQTQLQQWSNQASSQISGNFGVIIEACQSASFFPSLAGSKRFLIASASADQPAVISNQGLNSFSYYFWSEIRSGATLQNAFKIARQAMSSQTVLVGDQIQQQNAQLDTDGNSQFEANDYTVLGDYCLGACVQYAADEPQVIPLSTSTQLNGQQRLTLSIQVNHLSPLSGAWALIQRPDQLAVKADEPVSDSIRVALNCTQTQAEQSVCQGDYADFGAQGDYQITFYAQDQNQRISLPESVIALTQTQGAYASFNAKNGELILQDILVGADHFRVKLKQDHDFVFNITDFHLLSTGSTQDYRVDLNTGAVILPRVSAFEQFFSVQMQLQSNGQVALTSAQ